VVACHRLLSHTMSPQWMGLCIEADNFFSLFLPYFRKTFISYFSQWTSLLPARLMVQYCFAFWCLSSSVTLPAGGPTGRGVRGRSGQLCGPLGGRRCTMGQYSYATLGRHLLFLASHCHRWCSVHVSQSFACCVVILGVVNIPFVTVVLQQYGRSCLDQW